MDGLLAATATTATYTYCHLKNKVSDSGQINLSHLFNYMAITFSEFCSSVIISLIIVRFPFI